MPLSYTAGHGARPPWPLFLPQPFSPSSLSEQVAFCAVPLPALLSAEMPPPFYAPCPTLHQTLPSGSLPIWTLESDPGSNLHHSAYQLGRLGEWQPFPGPRFCA